MATIEFSTAVLAIVTAPVLAIVTSPLRAAAVNPVPSPISICVSATALSDGSPDELASLTLTVLAAMCASLALVIDSSAAETADQSTPLVAVESAVSTSPFAPTGSLVSESTVL